MFWLNISVLINILVESRFARQSLRDSLFTKRKKDFMKFFTCNFVFHVVELHSKIISIAVGFKICNFWYKEDIFG